MKAQKRQIGVSSEHHIAKGGDITIAISTTTVTITISTTTATLTMSTTRTSALPPTPSPLIVVSNTPKPSALPQHLHNYHNAFSTTTTTSALP
ncbi:hypothetical protein PoB_004455100 [Plakobranchus ocellatus]|uniref:Uncharacterized protein n=1 Tax=Plakobranchus ocellatus TaxID=259542 RepID=A0AAV4BGR8_9GAST|nr:hypothetical protein PoB_004455100 [Plakobranchus ocellatus]